MSAQVICRLDELAEGECHEFELRRAGELLSAFVLRFNGEVAAYLNCCPHTGAPLNWMPNRFFNLEGDRLQCALHGALFDPQDGACLYGPCQGEGLQSVPINLKAGVISINIQ